MPSEKDLDRIVHGTLFGEALLGINVPALLADEAGQYVAVNDAACTLTGYSRAKLISLRMGELAADERSRGIYSWIARDRKLRGRKRIRRNDGGTVECRYWAMRTTVARVPYFVLLIWPIASSGG